jgi:DNA polymerase III epsilon subunit-like protein
MKHLIFDTETTDLLASSSMAIERKPRVVEFAAILWDDATGDEQEFDWMFNPGVPIKAKASEKTRITDDMVQDKPPFADKAAAIRALLVLADVVVAHNLFFDMHIVSSEFRRADTADVKWPKGICTVESTEHLMGRRMKLAELHRFLFAEDFHGAHRAMVDVRATLRCYRELIKRGEL